MDKVRLKDVCTLINGRAFKQEELLDDGKYPVLRVGNFFSDKDYYYSNLELENDKYCENGDLLFAWSASFGPKIWYGNKVIFHYHIWKIILSSRVYRDYLYYYLLFFTERIKAEGHGGVMIHVTKKEMEERELFLPTKERQIEISVILDKLKNIIKGYQRELCLLDNCVKARFVEMFDHGEFPKLMIEELCSDIVDCPHSTPTYEGELKNPAIRTSEIKKGYILWDSMRYVSDEEYEKRVKRLRPKSGDIVYGREGTFGNAAVLPDGYKFCLGQRVMLLRPDYSKCTSEYLLHAIISDDVYRQAIGKNNASTVAHVNVKDVKQFKVPLPSLGKQRMFADFIKQIDKSKVVVPSKIKNAIFAIMLSVSFGQITSI